MGTARQPVRLRVAYKRPESLLGELTKSVGRGGVRIESKKSLPPGTRFVFELRSVGVPEPVEVPGTVMSVTESAPGRFVLHIRYEPPESRAGIESVLRSIFSASQADAKRKDPRIPLHVRAVDDREGSPPFRLRDISRGGVGIDVEADALPSYLRVGVPFLLKLKLSTGPLVVWGDVVWAMGTKSGALPLQLGTSFIGLPASTLDLLDDVLHLRALPAPPWIARLTFGPEALAQRKG